MLFNLPATARWGAIVLFVLAPVSLLAQAKPVLFYSDLTDGPRTGGEKNKGAYVCVFGRNFGTAQDSSVITVGSVRVDNYPVWGDANAPARGDSKACFQLGTGVPTGAQQVQMTVNGETSNSIPFYVREDSGADAIYCVSDVALPVGTGRPPSDNNNGHFGGGTGAGCFSTVARAWTATSNIPSAIVYLHNITDQVGAANACSGFVWCAGRSGTDANHMGAIASYPGAPSTLGNYSYRSGVTGIRVEYSHYTVANLVLRGPRAAYVSSAKDWAAGAFNKRVVSNDFSCSNGGGQDACWFTGFTNGFYAYGNYTHDVGIKSPHGYMPTAVPGGGPLDSGDAILVSVTSDGAGASGAGSSTCVATIANSPGEIFVGERDFGFAGGPGVASANNSLAYLPPGLGAVTAVGGNSFTFTCGVTVAGTFTSSTHPLMYYNTRAKLQHTTYIGTNTTNYNIGWNEWSNNQANNDLDVNATPVGVANPRNPAATGTWGVPNPVLPTDPAQPGYPVLGTAAGCSSGACMVDRTYYVSMSWLDASGNESDASHETKMTMAGGQLMTVSAPLFSIPANGNQATPGYLAVSGCDATCRAAQWCVFVGTSPGAGKKQGCFGSGVNYAEPVSGITDSGSRRLDFMTQTAGQLSGYPGTHVFVHDNVIHGGPNSGIQSNAWSPVPANVYGDASTGGGVYVYNNVIYRQAKSPYTPIVPRALYVTSYSPTNLGNSACIQMGSAAQNGPTIAGTLYVENNTCYDIGGHMKDLTSVGVVGFISVGQSQQTNCGMTTVANNNIMVSPNAPSDEPFWNPADLPCAWRLTGERNLWYNTYTPTTPPPAASAPNADSSCVRDLRFMVGTPCLKGNITADPLFINASADDFRLQAPSPAKSAGVRTYPTTDFLGVPRGLNGGYSLGAFEVQSSVPAASYSVFDLNGNGVVDQKDVDVAIGQLRGSCGNADVNRDGNCTVVDVQMIIKFINSPSF